MNTIAKWVAVSALLAGPIAADATAVTYAFTGTIITGPAANGYAGAAFGFYAGDTGTVSGTYTFDFAYNNPALASGVFSTATGGVVENLTGTNPRLPQPQTAPGNVFSSTLVGTSAGDAGLSYSTSAPPAAYESASGVQANLSFSQEYLGAPQYIAQESNYQTEQSGTQSAFLITGPSCDCQNPTLGFSSSGLPVFVPDLTYTGFVGTANGAANGLYFDITSFAPVTVTPPGAPEIDPGTAGSGLTLLAGLAAIARGRRCVAGSTGDAKAGT